jgi:hypothetical protein
MAVSLRDFDKADTGTIDGILVTKGIEIGPDHPASKICSLVVGSVDLHVKRLIEAQRLLGVHEEPINSNISCFSLYGPLIGYHRKGPFGFNSVLLASFD